MKRFLRPILLLLLSALLASGCSYVSYSFRKAHWQRTFSKMPTASVLRRAAPEDSLILSGVITRPPSMHDPLLLVVTTSEYRENEKVAVVQINPSSDDYLVLLPKSEYRLLVFADLNGNRYFEPREQVAAATVRVSDDEAKDGVVVPGPPLIVDPRKPESADFRIKVRVRPTSYVYASLDEEFFDESFGNKGLYHPLSLMAHTQGLIFGLEEYDEHKTAVLFVHGISGTPRDWKFMVEGLDRSRFQPFFFYYPSGLPLDMLAAFLAEVIDGFAPNGQAAKPRMVLAAHSMGGLVSVSAIQKLAAEGKASRIALYVSLSTPYGGDHAARKGIENAPLVVPVWEDIAADSDFLKNLYREALPDGLPFHLFFGYNDPSTFRLGESSDGTVTLGSQLRPEVQRMAVKVEGFNQTHAGILKSGDVRERFMKLLDSVDARGEKP